MRCPKPRHGGRQGIRFGRHRGPAWVWANQLKACCSYRRSSTVMCNENCWTFFFPRMEWLLLLCSYFLVIMSHHKSLKQTHKKWWMVEVLVVNLFFVGNLLGQMIVWCRWRKIPCTLKVRKAVRTEGFFTGELVHWSLSFPMLPSSRFEPVTDFYLSCVRLVHWSLSLIQE